MAAQKQDDQHEHTFSSYVRIQDVVLKTYLGRWTIGRSGERGSGISVLPARYDDDEDITEENQSPWLRRRYTTSILALGVCFRPVGNFRFFSTGQIPIFSTQLTLSHYILAPKRWELGICCKCRLKNTVGIKHIGARAWHDQPIDRIGPVRSPVWLSKNQSGVLHMTFIPRLTGQVRLNHLDPTLKHPGSPPTASGVLIRVFFYLSAVVPLKWYTYIL